MGSQSDNRFTETMAEAQAYVDKAEQLLKDTEADAVGAALAAAQLATAHVLAAIAQDLAEIRRSMGR